MSLPANIEEDIIKLLLQRISQPSTIAKLSSGFIQKFVENVKNRLVTIYILEYLPYLILFGFLFLVLAMYRVMSFVAAIGFIFLYISIILIFSVLRANAITKLVR